MAEHIIRLHEKFEKRRPSEREPMQREMFDLAVGGVRIINNKVRPYLRGFDVLRIFKPIHSEIETGNIVDIQRLHLFNTPVEPFSSVLTYVLAHGEDKARQKFADENIQPQLESAIRYAHYLQRILKKPDTDLELNENSQTTPIEIEAIWNKHMKRSSRIVIFAGDLGFGHRGELKKPRPDILIYSVDVGPHGHVVNNKGVLRIDWTSGANQNNKATDLRWGANGLQPTDGLRANPIQDDPLTFIISDDEIAFPQFRNPSSHLQDGIKFPSVRKVLEDPYHYLEVASRGIMQSLWHNLVLEMPSFIPLFSWEEMQDHYLQYPRQRLAFIDKIVDAFMIDPQKTFQLCEELGIWKATKLFSGVSEERMRKILDTLPGRVEHLDRLKKANREYSVFENLLIAINEVIPEANIDPKKDLLVFYEDIFPSGKK